MSYMFPLILAILCNTMDKIVTRNSLRKNNNPDAFLLVYQISSTFIITPFAYLSIKKTILELRDINILIFILISSMVMWSIYGISSFRTASLIDLSLSSTIGRLRLIWSALLGLLIFGEHISALQWLGMGIIMIANIMFVQLPSGSISRLGILYSLVSSITISLAMAFDKQLTHYIDPQLIVFIGFFGSASIAFIVNRKTNYIQLRKIVGPAFLASGFGACGYYFVVRAMSEGPISVIVPVYQSAHLLYILAGIIILGEVAYVKHKLISGCIAFLGIIFVFLGSQ